MRNSSYLKMAISILFHSKIRSWLTIIGIVIGVGAVVTIMSLSNSMSADLQSRLADMDLTSVTITPGYTKASSVMGPRDMSGSTSSKDAELTKKDIRAIKLIDNIDYIYGQISGRESVSYMGKSATLSINGVDPQVWQYTVTYNMESGRLLEPTYLYIAVIGYKVANEMYDNQIGLNRIITVNGKSVRVVGILASGENDNAVIMPIDAAVGVIQDSTPDVYDSIVVKVNSVDNVATVKQEIETKLMISRHVMNDKEKDFTVSDSLSRAESVTAMMSSISLFLGAIAGVSLIVGSVGIANTMFTSVMEKTREIGTMKAIGATNKDILMIFLFNSAMVGFVGGVIGILLSIILTSVMGPAMGISGMTVAPYLILLGISIAVFIGVVSGLVPAYNASRMKPVDALRYE
ncbi:ABC transporter permease [uncultured Methanomethylovorans sp.]|uniref:ABC transporter permease n=1 Tax=uncultured Methanomethylovorans sp. TaxID=183759 RepID=UPI002AA87669|nr:ABC transporter permease [uncultured Methanomethylovorans sp.]